MRTIILLLLLVNCSAAVMGQGMPITKVFILRHADKAGEDLSEAGQTRAKELNRVLGETHIDSIFSTNTPRTKHTAQVLADAQGLPVVLYDSEDQVINRVLKNCRGKRVVIVAHSNTVSKLIQKCGCTPPSSINPNIPDTQFDNLFLVVLEKNKSIKKCEVLHMKYGAVTP
jgi:broad specificity phosphatase PhoE